MASQRTCLSFSLVKKVFTYSFASIITRGCFSSRFPWRAVPSLVHSSYRATCYEFIIVTADEEMKELNRRCFQAFRKTLGSHINSLLSLKIVCHFLLMLSPCHSRAALTLPWSGVLFFKGSKWKLSSNAPSQLHLLCFTSQQGKYGAERSALVQTTYWKYKHLHLPCLQLNCLSKAL